MRIVALGPIGRGVTVEAFGSAGVTLGPVAKIEPGVGATGQGTGPTAVALAEIAPGGRIGRHPAATWQVFVVVSGSGWVAGADDVPQPLGVGEAAVWEPGEPHTSGSDAGMTVCIVEAPVDPTAAL
jgi:quercetin dioxygenase-like cupin family protein